MCSVWIDLYCTEPIVYIFIRHLHFHSTLAIVSTICCVCIYMVTTLYKSWQQIKTVQVIHTCFLLQENTFHLEVLQIHFRI